MDGEWVAETGSLSRSAPNLVPRPGIGLRLGTKHGVYGTSVSVYTYSGIYEKLFSKRR